MFFSSVKEVFIILFLRRAMVTRYEIFLLSLCKMQSLRGCEAIRVINWDEFLFFFFFFFVIVVANCNASCYWLHVHCSQWQLLLFFPSGIKIAFVAIWRVSCGELVYCLTRCTNPELVAKCEHILCMTSC